MQCSYFVLVTRFSVLGLTLGGWLFVVRMLRSVVILCWLPTCCSGPCSGWWSFVIRMLRSVVILCWLLGCHTVPRSGWVVACSQDATQCSYFVLVTGLPFWA